MSTTEVLQPQPDTIEQIEFDLIDRMYKSLRLAGIKPTDMAHHLGLHRNTVSGWLRGKAGMSKASLIAWAAKCSETSPVPITYEWLTISGEPSSAWTCCSEFAQPELPFGLVISLVDQPGGIPKVAHLDAHRLRRKAS